MGWGLPQRQHRLEVPFETLVLGSCKVDHECIVITLAGCMVIESFELLLRDYGADLYIQVLKDDPATSKLE